VGIQKKNAKANKIAYLDFFPTSNLGNPKMIWAKNYVFDRIFKIF